MPVKARASGAAEVHADRAPLARAAKPSMVFKTVADIMNWPAIIRSVTAFELLSGEIDS
jgi:hypothetical protein